MGGVSLLRCHFPPVLVPGRCVDCVVGGSHGGACWPEQGAGSHREESALLFAVGVFYYGGIARPWPDVQLSGVLPRIALCYLVAATLYVLLPRKGIVIATAACLLGYWALMLFVPFPNVDIKTPAGARKQVEAKTREELFAGAASTTKGTFKEGLNLAHYVDACWLPGRKRNLYYSNEGLLSTIQPWRAPSLGSWLGGCSRMGGGVAGGKWGGWLDQAWQVW